MDRATSTEQDRGNYAMWTPAFEQLHEAVLTGASPEEIRQLEATELNELAADAPTAGGGSPWPGSSEWEDDRP